MKALLYILILATGVQAGSAEPEKYKGLINKATNLALQHDRLQASQVLKNAIQEIDEKPTKNNKEIREKLISTLNNVSELFFQDQTQQHFETALAIAFQNPKLALTRLEEALRIEQYNQAVLLMHARLNMADKNCKQALEDIQKALSINPYSKSVQLAQAQTQFCLNQLQPELVAELEPKLKDDVFWQQLLARHKIALGEKDKALELLENIIKTKPQYPEPFFTLTQAFLGEDESEKKNEVYKKYAPAEQYLKLCEALSVRARREFAIDPWLCQVEQVKQVQKQSSDTPEQDPLPNSEDQ